MGKGEGKLTQHFYRSESRVWVGKARDETKLARPQSNFVAFGKHAGNMFPNALPPAKDVGDIYCPTARSGSDLFKKRTDLALLPF